MKERWLALFFLSAGCYAQSDPLAIEWPAIGQPEYIFAVDIEPQIVQQLITNTTGTVAFSPISLVAHASAASAGGAAPSTPTLTSSVGASLLTAETIDY